ncbi:MAG: conjugal transfer protein TraX [Clostridiales bacterium]|nr:conjugal transfer protein TraX [Clostridiales bacterium]
MEARKTGRSAPGFNQNQLKLIAAATMLVDHIGAELLPGVIALRIIGRLSFPLFAYFIYEGSRYTHDRRAYLTRMLGLGLLCVAAYYVYDGEIYGNVLITFSLSICVLYAVQEWKRRRDGPSLAVVALCLLGAYLLCLFVTVDYGFLGVLLPVFAELCSLPPEVCARLPQVLRERLPLLGFGVGLLLLSLETGWVQPYSLLSLLLLLAYNGQRGSRNLKNFFYWFYPLHLLAIGGVSMLLS